MHHDCDNIQPGLHAGISYIISVYRSTHLLPPLQRLPIPPPHSPLPTPLCPPSSPPSPSTEPSLVETTPIQCIPIQSKYLPHLLPLLQHQHQPPAVAAPPQHGHDCRPGAGGSCRRTAAEHSRHIPPAAVAAALYQHRQPLFMCTAQCTAHRGTALCPVRYLLRWAS